jgi:hypothetical protein
MNNIKEAGDGVALQITKPARAAELVEENEDGEATDRSNLRVHSFDGLVLVVDIEAVPDSDVAELVSSAAEDTGSIYRAETSRIQIAGHGYQVHLPVAEDAGFEIGDRAGTHPAPGIIAITKADPGEGSSAAARLGKDIVTIRRAQLE